MISTVRTQVEERKKPMIPSLGPNLGKLGFTDLKNDEEDGDKVNEAVPAMQAPPVTAAPRRGPPMGLGLNLASV